MVKRLRDKKIVPQRCWDLKIVKQGGGEVMIKKDQDTPQAYFMVWAYRCLLEKNALGVCIISKLFPHN